MSDGVVFPLEEAVASHQWPFLFKANAREAPSGDQLGERSSSIWLSN